MIEILFDVFCIIFSASYKYFKKLQMNKIATTLISNFGAAALFVHFYGGCYQYLKTETPYNKILSIMGFWLIGFIASLFPPLCLFYIFIIIIAVSATRHKKYTYYFFLSSTLLTNLYWLFCGCIGMSV